MRIVIVDREHPEVYSALQVVLQRASGTLLIWDRRMEPDRRRQQGARRADRRQLTSAIWAEHHWLVFEHDVAPAN
jgi:hypothetical protein